MPTHPNLSLMTFEAQTDMALGRGWDAVRGLLASLTAALTASNLIRVAARREALVLLRQAEALVRRALLIMALRLPAPRPRTPRPASAETLAHLQALPSAEVPAFPLDEPHPTAFSFWEVMSVEEAHSVATIGAVGWDCGDSKEDQFVKPGQLIQRLATLQNTLNAPEKQVRRMARWLTRQRAAREHGPARLDPLRLGGAPTVTKARRQRRPESTQALSDLHHFARATLDSS